MYSFYCHLCFPRFPPWLMPLLLLLLPRTRARKKLAKRGLERKYKGGTGGGKGRRLLLPPRWVKGRIKGKPGRIFEGFAGKIPPLLVLVLVLLILLSLLGVHQGRSAVLVGAQWCSLIPPKRGK